MCVYVKFYIFCEMSDRKKKKQKKTKTHKKKKRQRRKTSKILVGKRTEFKTGCLDVKVSISVQ